MMLNLLKRNISKQIQFKKFYLKSQKIQIQMILYEIDLLQNNSQISLTKICSKILNSQVH